MRKEGKDGEIKIDWVAVGMVAVGLVALGVYLGMEAASRNGQIDFQTADAIGFVAKLVVAGDIVALPLWLMGKKTVGSGLS
jgi:hypothetical protein